VCGAAIVFSAPTVVRALAGIPLALFLPGYAVTAAVFARHRLDWVTVLVLSIAFSFVVVILGGVLLNALPPGLTESSWATLVVLSTVGAAGFAAPRVERDAPEPRKRVLPRLTRPEMGLLALSIVLVSAAAVLARTPLPAAGVRGYTTLSIVPRATSAGTVTLGVQSSETRPTAYRLKVLENAKRVRYDRRLTLAPGQRWLLPISVDRSARRLDAQLFRGGTVYRRVRLLLPLSARAPERGRSSTAS
jgi:uncharacterized membrane protein